MIPPKALMVKVGAGMPEVAALLTTTLTCFFRYLCTAGQPKSRAGQKCVNYDNKICDKKNEIFEIRKVKSNLFSFWY